MIREPPRRNSGVVGGNFLAKMKLKHPDGKLVTAADILIGATLTLASHTFIILDADEATLKYMEQRPTQFPHSDREVVSKLYATYANAAWSTGDDRCIALERASGKTESMGFAAFERMLKSLVPSAVKDVPPKHSAITLWRHFARDGKLFLCDLPF